MPNEIYLNESFVRSQVKHFGWTGFLAVCCKYSLHYLIAFSAWIFFSVLAHMCFVGCLFCFGLLPVQQQANPAARPWAGLLLVPLALVLGFLARFVDSKTWEFHPARIVVRSTIQNESIELEQIDAIVIEESEDYEVWTVETRDKAETDFAIFLKTKHNQKMKKQLFESGRYDELVVLVTQAG